MATRTNATPQSHVPRNYPAEAADDLSDSCDEAAALSTFLTQLGESRRLLIQTQAAVIERQWRRDANSDAMGVEAKELRNDLARQIGEVRAELLRVRGILAETKSTLTALEEKLGLRPFSFSSSDLSKKWKSVVGIDLVDYGSDARYRQRNFDTAQMGILDHRIREEIERAIHRCGGDPVSTWVRSGGDGGVLVFEHPHDAIRFAEVFFALVEEYNAKSIDDQHRWWFRMAVADGELVYRHRGAEGLEPAGEPLMTVARLLPHARPGELLVDQACYRACDDTHRRRFVRRAVRVSGKKKEEQYLAYRLIVLPEAAKQAKKARRWQPNPPAPAGPSDSQ